MDIISEGLIIGLVTFILLISFFFSFLLMPFIFKEGGDLHNIVNLILVAIPVELGYIPAYRAVFANNRYLQYFKQFEKEDEQWHRKWKRITCFFCIGSVVTFFSGVGAAFFMLIVL